jgi:hypothetical protein
MREWLRSLAVLRPRTADERASAEPLSDEGAQYLIRIARDGTLNDVFAEMAGADADVLD